MAISPDQIGGDHIEYGGQHSCGTQIVRKNGGKWHCPKCDSARAKLIANSAEVQLSVALRNAAPAMFAVLECFQEGDANLLELALSDTEDNGSELRKVIIRLQKAASLMEGKGDDMVGEEVA